MLRLQGIKFQRGKLSGKCALRLAGTKGKSVLKDRLIGTYNKAARNYTIRCIGENAFSRGSTVVVRKAIFSGGKLVDATQGRKTRAIIVTSTDHLILSAVAVETITQRWNERGSGARGGGSR